MGKTRVLIKKIRDTKKKFYAKMQRWVYRRQKWCIDLTEAEDNLKTGGNNTQKNYTRKVLMTQKTMMVWSLTQSQTSWSVESSGPQEALL